MLFYTIGCHILPYSKTHHFRIVSFSIFSYLLRYKRKLNSCQSTWELMKEWSCISCWLPSRSSYGQCYTVPCYLHHTRMWMSSMTDFLVQFSSVAQSCPTLFNPMDCSMPGFPVHQQLQRLLKLMSIEPVMPSNHLMCVVPSPPTFNLSQHQGLFKWVMSPKYPLYM